MTQDDAARSRREAPSWAPMVVIAMAQTVVVFNITTLQIAIDGIAYQFNAPASSV